MNYLDSSKYELRPRGKYVHVYDRERGSVTRLIPAGDPRVAGIGDAAPARPNGTEGLTDKQIRELLAGPTPEPSMISYFNGKSFDEGMQNLLSKTLETK